MAPASASDRAIALGYSDVDWMLQDPDFEELKAHPGFAVLLEKMKPAH